ncbi:hypothetical protein D9758_015645 [Tetrapyrgos nigripes]|uniref:Uncharacterized protein n=1 Tax=Tetrapyrgos nigripes TaxID=182062 RepID=A0A8H5CKM6_9AGAR|nr:hypothetical protein D9758_015645 [Tetrapyrgos nigripes]
MSSLTFSLVGKVAVITGSSRGIGAAVALRLAEEGAKVVVNYVNSASAAEKIVSTIKSKGNGDAIAVKADVGSVEGVVQLLDESVKAFGKIDALVLNAAIMLSNKGLVEVDEPFFDAHMKTNVKGPFFAVKHAVDKGMFPAEGGRVVFFSTSLTMNSAITPNYLVYTMSKGAVEQMARILAKDLASKNITVNTVSPGPIDTDLFRHEKTQELINRIAASSPFNRLGQPEEVAALVAFLVSPGSQWVSGQNIRVNGVYNYTGCYGRNFICGDLPSPVFNRCAPCNHAYCVGYLEEFAAISMNDESLHAAADSLEVPFCLCYLGGCKGTGDNSDGTLYRESKVLLPILPGLDHITCRWTFRRTMVYQLIIRRAETIDNGSNIGQFEDPYGNVLTGGRLGITSTVGSIDPGFWRFAICV